MTKLLTLLAVAVTLTSCATLPTPTQSAAIGPVVPHDISAGQARLAARVYPRLAATAASNDNLFVSPLSLAEGLGLAAFGARGQTETELRSLLGWDAGRRPELLIQDYDRALTRTGDDRVALSVANALWLSNRLTFEDDYLAAVRSSFGASASTLDFAGDPQGSAASINGWVASKTREQIKTIVGASAFDVTTAAVLTNAVWFKADWSVPFDDGTPRDFTRGDGSKRDIYMMERIAPLAYRETRDGQAVALPYGKDGRFVMEVFLPRDSATLRRWERDLSPLSFMGGELGSDGQFDLSDAPEREILLRLPRFEARFRNSIKPALIAAGIPCAFSETCADFSGMAKAPLAIDDVAHATFLRVDEQGTEAAAVTAVTIRVTGARIVSAEIPRMIVDRPFLVAIRDRSSGALIFFGRIADPTPVGTAE